MTSESKVAILSILVSAVVAVTTVLSGNDTQKELQKTQHIYDQKIIEMTREHERELSGIASLQKAKKERCDEINIIMADLIALLRKESNKIGRTDKENLSYFKALYYLSDDKKLELIESADNESLMASVKLLMKGISTEYGKCYNNT